MSASLFDIYWGNNDYEREYKFYVYATDKKDYYLDEVYKSDDRERIATTIKKWAAGTSKKKWAKKHLGENKVIELTVTKGENNWSGDIDLEIDTNTNQAFLKEDGKRKPWNGKLVFHRK